MSEPNEQLQELEAGLSDLGSEIATLKEYLESSGSKLIERMLSEQIELRKNAIVFTPLQGENNIYAQEYMKGEVQGLSLARALAQTHLEQLQMAQKVLIQQVESEREKETDRNTAVESRLEPRVER